jgi:flagellar biosynthetic protein FlhB
MADQFGEKIHEATPHRREEARKKGNVPKSQDLGSALILVIATGGLLFAGQQGLSEIEPYFLEQLGGEAWVVTSADQLANDWLRMLWVLGWSTVPMLTLLMVAAIAANLMQTGIMFLPEKLNPDLERINPLKGFSRLVSWQSAARVGFGLFKILIVMAVAAASLWAQSNDLVEMVAWTVPEFTSYLMQTILWVSFKIAVALLILAVVDYVFQAWKMSQDLRMTDQEIREEFKQLQGDPQVLGRRKQVQRQLAQSRIATSVPTADAIITNPTELAVAIKYEPTQMRAPVVVAKGAGTMAQRIRRLALENHIPIVERKELAQALYRDVAVHQEIPADQYNAVAEVLRYVYQLQGKSLPNMPVRAA